MSASPCHHCLARYGCHEKFISNREFANPSMPKTPQTNTLFYGDNLHILRDYIEDASVDLVYLDPPFNSSATYNVLFKSPVFSCRMSGRTW